MTPQLSWYVARSSGIVAWAMVAASMVWGIAVAGRPLRRRGLHARRLDLHRYLGLLSLVFTAVHVAGLVGDNYVHFGWSEVLVPMASTWQPGAVAWGVVAMYVMIAILLTSWAMRWLPRRLWRAVHLTSVALFATSTVHGLQAGTDSGNRAVLGLMLGGTALVLVLSVVRIGGALRRRVAADAVRREAPTRVGAVGVDALGRTGS